LKTVNLTRSSLQLQQGRPAGVFRDPRRKNELPVAAQVEQPWDIGIRLRQFL
jgi:hypothetical protein